MRGIEVPRALQVETLDKDAARRRTLAQAITIIQEQISVDVIVESLREALKDYGLGDFGEDAGLYQRYALPGGFPLSGGGLGAQEGPGEQWQSDIRRAFGKALTSIRDESGLDTPGLAQKSTVNITTVRRLEQGDYEPMLVTIFNLAFALSIAPSKLIAEMERMLIGRPCPSYIAKNENSIPLPQPVASDIARALGMTLFALRRWTGLGQEHFARRVGMDRTYVSQIERFQHDLGLFFVMRLAGATGITGERFVQTVEAVLQAGLRKGSAEEFLLSAARLRG